MWLFGSRPDDATKGGDIDLYIELPVEDYVYAKKLRFWCELVKRLGDQKIDIVINKIGVSRICLSMMSQELKESGYE